MAGIHFNLILPAVPEKIVLKCRHTASQTTKWFYEGSFLSNFCTDSKTDDGSW